MVSRETDGGANHAAGVRHIVPPNRAILGDMQGVPDPVRLAVELVDGGADVVVVGGTGALLRSGHHRPRDLDVVVAPTAVRRLLAVLTSMEVGVPDRPLSDGSVVRLLTGWGPLDVFVAEPPASVDVTVDGVAVRVAGR